jgi:hypothetical protein
MHDHLLFAARFAHRTQLLAVALIDCEAARTQASHHNTSDPTRNWPLRSFTSRSYSLFDEVAPFDDTDYSGILQSLQQTNNKRPALHSAKRK